MSEAMPNSVLPIFGENLKDLIELRGSAAQVSRELGISRVQMGRYLNATSFPKPHQLKAMCDYFGVDARILTDRLTAADLEEIRVHGGLYKPKMSNRSLMQAFDYIGDLAPFSEKTHEFPDGLYRMQGLSQTIPDTITTSFFQITTLRRARVARMTLPVRFADVVGGSVNHTSRKDREIRGIVCALSGGAMVQFYSARMQRLVGTTFLEPLELGSAHAYRGYFSMARPETVGVPLVSRVSVEWIEPRCRALIRAAHAPRFIKVSDAPEGLRKQLRLEKDPSQG